MESSELASSSILVADAEKTIVFRCKRQWEHLAPTANPSVRTCGQCRQAVFQVMDAEGLKQAVAAGRCVFVETEGVRLIGETRLDADVELSKPLNWAGF